MNSETAELINRRIIQELGRDDEQRTKLSGQGEFVPRQRLSGIAFNTIVCIRSPYKHSRNAVLSHDK